MRYISIGYPVFRVEWYRVSHRMGKFPARKSKPNSNLYGMYYNSGIQRDRFLLVGLLRGPSMRRTGILRSFKFARLNLTGHGLWDMGGGPEYRAADCAISHEWVEPVAT